MKICNNVSPAESCCGLETTATLGTFDGVHIGHRHILHRVISHAIETGKQSAVITFDRHPASVLHPENSPKILTTLDEKLAVFETLGIDVVYVLTFTKQIADMTAEQFIVKYLLDCLGMSCFIVGYDHGFGKERKGSTDSLRELTHKYNFTLEIQQPVTYNGMIVNSSAIRIIIADGKVDMASELLGNDYSFDGSVVPGLGYGKEIGYPTANIKLSNQEKIVPADGVYTGWMRHGAEKMDAVISIGPRPTFNCDETAIEVHVPDFDGDIYDAEVSVGFRQRLRDIEKFDSKEELIEQIKKDIEMLNQHIPL